MCLDIIDAFVSRRVQDYSILPITLGGVRRYLEHPKMGWRSRCIPVHMYGITNGLVELVHVPRWTGLS